MFSPKRTASSGNSDRSSNPATTNPELIPVCEGSTRPNQSRHRAKCKICQHQEREKIEQDFVLWMPAKSITKKYKLRDRASIYRHAHAMNLLEARWRNRQMVLSRVMERADEVEVTGAAVVAAVRLSYDLESRDTWREQQEREKLNALFARMAHEELEKYAQTGALPDRFKELVDDPNGGSR